MLVEFTTSERYRALIAVRLHVRRVYSDVKIARKCFVLSVAQQSRSLSLSLPLSYFSI